MPMREECVHFQSRTYASGEAARFCRLDLAPEAPWRCPDNCPSYKRRLADVEERLDFTERLLAQERQGARLPPAHRSPLIRPAEAPTPSRPVRI